MKRRMRFVILPAILSAIICFVLLSGVSDADQNDSNAQTVERGRYLVQLAGCSDCHTPKIMTPQGPVVDSTRLFMGHPAEQKVTSAPENLGKDGWIVAGNPDFTAWAGPWGISFAANLTSAPEYGIGNWKADQFIKAMRTGKHRGFGRPILPPMPWFNMMAASDEDLAAMFTYFQATRPIENLVPEPVIAGGK